MTGSGSGAAASDVGASFVPADPAKAGADRGDEVAAPAEHEKGDTDMKGWAEPEHLHAQPGSQTAWVSEVA